jgi:hypothetical protein
VRRVVTPVAVAAFTTTISIIPCSTTRFRGAFLVCHFHFAPPVFSTEFLRAHQSREGVSALSAFIATIKAISVLSLEPVNQAQGLQHFVGLAC